MTTECENDSAIENHVTFLLEISIVSVHSF